MSYQVLARKWRPKRFSEMVGQEHVLKALVNALDDDRLHHAYLFTGTRGVGKTSIARLFAKSLNCEQGVSSEPCGQCSACVEIAEGRFVDLIEVDAASRTKVEDTRELLENVQYAPTHGRFKVYLIDEVHMLSTSSFNALLKTLEEPPPHVKFLLATTDPQKLPMTVLSRCLQFNLKNLTAERIQQHLAFVLGEEQIEREEAALWLLARSADGSMRDALSLTDQAIAFGAGAVRETEVRAMLGTIDQHLVYSIIQSLAAQDPAAVLAAVQSLSEFSPDYHSVLGEMLSLLHRVALAQVYPAAVDNSLGDRDQVMALAQQMRPEEVQLYYQVALMGRKDLPMVPEPREGLEMTLLRMLAFRPAGVAPQPQNAAQATSRSTAPAQSGSATESPAPAPAPTPAPAPARPAPAPAPTNAAEPSAVPPSATPAPPPPPPSVDEPPPWDDVPPDLDEGAAKKPDPAGVSDVQPVSNRAASSADAPPRPGTAPAPGNAPSVAAGMRAFEGDLKGDRWAAMLPELGLSGMVESIARNLSLEEDQGERLCFFYTREQEAMLSNERRERISSAICEHLGQRIDIEFRQGEQSRETPAQLGERRRAARLAEAVKSIEQDEKVAELAQHFGAKIDYDSVRPID
ncbi:DNA polymerase III subunit gamma/tau [Marinobacterium sp. AK62]|uniref:DNA polymerase III subunit gamma/tau n=1 Tax=Marinobacterium alkalitolerans TaxID=1542925 RepID=A0ABS3ZCX5_9GAMM|nr:DNA polymerase III subunit gamma/tau [Marinobacterium alkalitolerans]MBP0049555.1 DNA polymerase III subunit gamma/tau [Marinobacterium alkalitolerans]